MDGLQMLGIGVLILFALLFTIDVGLANRIAELEQRIEELEKKLKQ